MSGYLPTLNGWRGIAILAVLLCHGSATLFAPSGGICPNRTWYDWALRGETGVDVFFGISGLLICSKLAEERRRTGRVDLRRFYVRRTFRIIPASLVFLGVLGLLTETVPLPVARWEWWSSLLYVRNYLPGLSGEGWFTGHFWSLAVEEHFYLLWPALMLLGAASEARRRILVLALLFAAWGIGEARWHCLERVWPVPPEHRTDVRLGGLLWGCWMALVLVEPARRERMTRWLSGWRGVGFVALLGVVAVSKLPMGQVMLGFLVPFALAATVLHPGTWVGRFLECGPLQAVGKLSYSLYLWQQLFLVPPKLLPHPPLGWVQLWPWNWVATFACAAISYRLVEQPLIGLGHRWTASPSVEERQPMRRPHVPMGRPLVEGTASIREADSGRD